MIRYVIVCECDHTFESWFDNSAAYDKLQKNGLVECPRCGSGNTRKGMMAPQLARTRHGSTKSPPTPPAMTEKSGADLQEFHKQASKLFREMREHIKNNAENVGDSFAQEARKIHFQEVEPRNIYGRATLEEAAELVEDGIDFTPLPNLPEDKN